MFQITNTGYACGPREIGRTHSPSPFPLAFFWPSLAPAKKLTETFSEAGVGRREWHEEGVFKEGWREISELVQVPVRNGMFSPCVSSANKHWKVPW